MMIIVIHLYMHIVSYIILFDEILNALSQTTANMHDPLLSSPVVE